MTFSAPSSGSGNNEIRFQDLDGALVALRPLKVERDIMSKIGDLFDAVVADAWVVTGPHARPEPYLGMWWMGKALMGQLTGAIGTDQVILGRLGKPSGKRYWLLADPTEQEVEAATFAFPALAGTTSTAVTHTTPQVNVTASQIPQRPAVVPASGGELTDALPPF